jgi:glycosyltransferase involved in cell wall biosynthesis
LRFLCHPEKAESNRPYQALLEAQAAGRAVITMDTDLAQITTEAGRSGLLAKDSEEFQTHLLALAKDRSRCDEMGRAAAAFVARSYSIEVRAAQIEQLLLGSAEAANVRYPLPAHQSGVFSAQEMLTKNPH